MSTIGERLEFTLKYFNITKKDFALSIKYSPGNITDWIKGRYKPSSRALINIEKKYNISQKWLIEGTGKMFINNTDAKKKIDIELTSDEVLLIQTYRKLDRKSKKKIEGFSQYLAKALNSKENIT